MLAGCLQVTVRCWGEMSDMRYLRPVIQGLGDRACASSMTEQIMQLSPLELALCASEVG